MRKLWIFGDSFAYVPDNTPPHIWQLRLSEQFDSLEICAGPGTSFDWIWAELYKYQDEIKPTDQVVVVLTEPSRHWFFKDIPGLTHAKILNLDEYVDKEQATALEYYLRYIQRDDLDNLNVMYKLGWLSQIVNRKRWNKPILLSGFSRPTYNPSQFPNLIGCTGNLTLASVEEVINQDKYTEFFHARDFRYNHLCLDNHKVLADKVIMAIATGAPINLTTGFAKNILTDENVSNPNWIQQQVDPVLFKELQEERAKGPLKNWAKRIGLVE